MAEPESLRDVAQARAPFSAWLGIVLLFALFGVIVLALIGPSVRKDHYEEERAKKRVEYLKGLREQDNKTLTTYGWVEKEKGSAHIPIDRAMHLMVAELAAKKPAAAYAVAPDLTASPAAAPAPPASAPVASPKVSPAPSASLTPASGTSSSTAPSPLPKMKENEGPQSEIHLQPAAAANPPNVAPGTQPGAAATPHASPGVPTSKPAVSPTGTPNQKAPGSPLPVAGQTPSTLR